MLSYSEQLRRDPVWGLNEARKIFHAGSKVDESLERIVERLEALGIPYALAGGLAVFRHGLQRFTQDVDLLVRPEDLVRIHQNLEGRGYLPRFRGSKNLYDTDSGVSIEFLVAGEYPGDGKPKPIVFPDPEDVTETMGGVRCLNLVTLIELKLASGMSAQHRAQDLVDVQRLAEVLYLPRTFAERLNPYVREKFEEIWFPHRYALVLDDDATELETMRQSGITIEPGREERSVIARTEDPELAKQFGMHDESEFW